MVSLLKILKALADENRLKIVELLLLHNPCVGAIAMHVGISEAAVSQHLKILKDVGLLDGERCGHFTHYRINQAVIIPFLVGLQSRAYAACFSFMAGVMPPIPMFGRSLL